MYPLRRTSTIQSKFLRPESGHPFENAVLILVVEELRGRDIDLIRAQLRKALPHLREPIGFRILKRAKQNGVDDAENRRVRADAERQRDDRYSRESGFLHQHSRAVAQVL